MALVVHLEQHLKQACKLDINIRQRKGKRGRTTIEPEQKPFKTKDLACYPSSRREISP